MLRFRILQAVALCVFVFSGWGLCRIVINQDTCHENGRLFDNSLQSNLADEMQVVLDEVFLIADWMSTKGRGYQTGSQRIGFLYKALFGISDTDHAAEKVIAASFNDILKRKSTDEVTTTIYCEDDFIVKTGTDGEWINTITGDLYTGDTTEDHFECTDEVFGFALGPNVVVLCRRTLIDPWFTIGDRRSWHHVTSFHLDEYAAIATGVLLHELLHSASVLDDRKFRIKDQSDVNTQGLSLKRAAYGFDACVRLAKHDPNRLKKCYSNADSLTLLALGIWLYGNDWSYGYAMPAFYPP